MKRIKETWNAFVFIVGITLLILICVAIGSRCEQHGLFNTLNHVPPVIKPWPANVSAYCPCSKCCGQFADGITASGHVIKPGDRFVAAPKEIPFGTMIDIPGYGRVPVLDRGGAIKGNKLDVFFSSHQEALNWGRQYLEVQL